MLNLFQHPDIPETLKQVQGDIHPEIQGENVIRPELFPSLKILLI
jgi:hypothetical protein